MRPGMCVPSWCCTVLGISSLRQTNVGFLKTQLSPHHQLLPWSPSPTLPPPGTPTRMVEAAALAELALRCQELCPDHRTLGQEWWLCMKVSRECWTTDPRKRMTVAGRAQGRQRPGPRSAWPQEGHRHRTQRAEAGQRLAPCS